VACSRPYRPDLCTQVNTRVLNCIPTDPGKKEYDLIIGVDTIGMACVSSKDFSEGKKRLRQALRKLNTNVLNVEDLVDGL
jgi:hypothetical protein